MSQNHLTKRFYCNAVFQGGGCKAVAYVGAYKVAYEDYYIRFSRIAGTSAGSIIAALVGAGAKPRQLEEIIRRLDFSKFTQLPPKGMTPWPRTDEGMVKKCLRVGIHSVMRAALWCAVPTLPPNLATYARSKNGVNIKACIDFAERFVVACGYYSIAPVRDWIDEELAKLTGKPRTFT